MTSFSKAAQESALITVGWSLLAFAALVTLFLIVSVIRQYRLLHLPVVQGVMIDCKPLLTSERSAGGGAITAKWTITGSFSYQVDSKAYVGNQFSQRPVGKLVRIAKLDPPEDIAQICQEYAAGKSVQVYFHPEAPDDSFVYFNSPFSDNGWVWAIIPLVHALFGTFLIANAYRVR